MDTKIGLIFQLSGIIFITVLLFLLTQSLKSGVLNYWKKSWLSLSVALGCLQIASQFEVYPNPLAQPFILIYFFGEYLFIYFLILGCYNFTTGKRVEHKKRYFVVSSLLISLGWTFGFSNFNSIFNAHSFILGTGFLIAFITLKPTDSSEKNLGWKLMRVSLLILTINFFHYSVLFTLRQTELKLAFPKNYIMFSFIIDLLLEILLGFGMVIVLMEKVRQEVVEANRKLQEAHKKLEHLVHTDSLTTAFSRHAFYGFLKKNGNEQNSISGCVGFFDIDDLKPINDEFGHHVGDMVIRAVTTAIRSLMRAEDLIFRWGGDEFFVIMVSMSEEMARDRMDRLTDLLKDVRVDGVKESLTVGVSFGFTDFNDVSELEKSIKLADEAMYRNKQKRKLQKSAMIKAVLQKNQSMRLSV